MNRCRRAEVRPIVMTALATIAGMIRSPLAIGAGSQMLQPLAIAVIGGPAWRLSMVLVAHLVTTGGQTTT